MGVGDDLSTTRADDGALLDQFSVFGVGGQSVQNVVHLVELRIDEVFHPFELIVGGEVAIIEWLDVGVELFGGDRLGEFDGAIRTFAVGFVLQAEVGGETMNLLALGRSQGRREDDLGFLGGGELLNDLVVEVLGLARNTVVAEAGSVSARGALHKLLLKRLGRTVITIDDNAVSTSMLFLLLLLVVIISTSSTTSTTPRSWFCFSVRKRITMAI